MEPKILYRAAVEEVPQELYTLPLSKAEIVKPGADLTIVSYGRPLYTCAAAIEAAEKELNGATIELIDLRTIFPWDRSTILESVKRTGRAIVVHESMVNFGVGAELVATIQEKAFLHLQSPVKRLGGWSTHTGLAWEKYILPDVTSKSPRLHSFCALTYFQESTTQSMRPWLIDLPDHLFGLASVLLQLQFTFNLF